MDKNMNFTEFNLKTSIAWEITNPGQWVVLKKSKKKNKIWIGIIILDY